ncbi:thiol reductant ABC exporter subunit CydD [Nesterenkonia aerolata]|uniref:Thiol reductant ABC exporter subunit CydD n=1 Tax=Nesterenkonia aerolata TaxID=3074079 RepID=A0ABU2DU64_9MICC|nr:thiol reductant ABC exporter subunit CydD [Nesterenkonia sp. LY-0111]MDR8020030.1 thiol reductant ABC exporter subunit CydD [Nesterenkonia sp. LY-0111]
MRPIDPRLLRRATAAQGFLALTVVLGLLQILLIIAFCALVAMVVVTAVEGVGVQPGEWVLDDVVVDRVVPGADLLARVAPLLAGLLAVVGARGVVAWAMEAAAVRAAARVKSQLRRATAQALVTTAQTQEPVSQAHAVTVLGSGLDALDAWFSRYLPQLVLTVLAIPILLTVLAVADLTTAVIVAITMPLVPLFMVLIGWATQSAQQAQWRRLDRLGAAYLDVVEGLSTLKIFNRQHRQRQNLRRLTDQHRASTMKVLRVSFLSGFALELAASLSVALVAVSIGVRLIDGELGLFVGLFVLMVVPEAYNPLRQVGAQYHAAADGVAASEDVFEIVERAESETESGAEHWAGFGADPGTESRTEPRTELRGDDGPGCADLQIRGMTVHRGGRAVLADLDLTAGAGELTVLTGPSGAGKSTVFAALLGLLPHGGEALCGERRVGREDIAWTGQRHGLRRGSVAENITLGDDTADGQRRAEDVSAVLADVGLEGLDPQRSLGVHGAGLSGGQAHRVAVARALYRARRRQSPVLLLDEPSAALDTAAERRLLETLRAEAERGRVVLVISHRPAVMDAADTVIGLEPGSADGGGASEARPGSSASTVQGVQR